MRGRHRPGYMAAYRARKAVERDGSGLLPFQGAYVRAVCRSDSPVEIAALSVPRGMAKVGSAEGWLRGV